MPPRAVAGAKRTLERIFPRLYSGLAGVAHRLRFAGQDSSRVFEDIFQRNAWRGDDSLSGTGSDLRQTEFLRSALPELVRDLGIRSMLDIPCGDFYWMRHVELGVAEYIGADVVSGLVQQNSEHFDAPGRTFVVRNLVRDPLPVADLIFCRDCLVHLSFAEIQEALENINRCDARFLLTTTFVNRATNRNIRTGAWRPINLEKPPFNLGRPLRVITEQCTEDDGAYADKSLGLWRLPLQGVPGGTGTTLR